MSDEEIFFPPYGQSELREVLEQPLSTAFRDDALPESVIEYGITEAAKRWGDARRALRLFRRAGERADELGLEQVTTNCIEQAIEATDAETITEKIMNLPYNYFSVLFGITARSDPETGEIIQPVSTAEIADVLQADELPERLSIETSTIRDIIRNLETLGLVETWTESRGREGRVKQIKTSFDPTIVQDVSTEYIDILELNLKRFQSM